MKLENSFEVAAPAADAWDLLMDVPRVIPCMPGAELVETVDESTWKARMRVKLGPIQLSFLADVARESADEAARVVRLSANAREERGRGAARATIESTLADHDGGTRVDVVTDLNMTGAVAQYGRGMVQGVAGQLMESFAACLERELEPPAAGGEAAPPEAAATGPRPVEPISGFALAWRAFTHWLRRLFRRG